MRIAWFSHRYFPCIGGAENYGRAMVRRFVAAGHEVDVITSDALDLWYFTNPRWQRVEEPAESRVDGARVRRLPVRHFPLQRYVKKALSFVPHWPTQCRIASYMPIIPGIERIRGDYDAVFAVGFPFTLFSYAALKTARSADAPLVLTPFLHLSTPGDPVNRHYTKPHQTRLLAQADLIVTPTELEAEAISDWGIPRSRLLRLPMAVEHAEVTGGVGERFRGRLGIPQDRAVVGQLGALHPNKGTTDLVRAVARLNEGCRDGRLVHLILAGAPSPEFDAFRAQLPEATAQWLSVLGPLPAADVPDFYAALDVFAMPSRTDSFGIVFLEAWANARPVVAAAAGGVREVVEHDRTGLLVPFGDVIQLAGSLDRLLTEPETRKRLGLAGKALVENGYTWDDRFATLGGRLRDLIAARKPHPTPRPHAFGAIRREREEPSVLS